MDAIITRGTATESWQSLVHSAGECCNQALDEDLESYLVFMLMRHTENARLADTILATQYLQGMQSGGHSRIQRLQEVGDQCLLFSGFFPKRSERRLVKVHYYVDLGRSAYSHISEKMKRDYAQLYERLSEQFVVLMDILQAMRTIHNGYVLDSRSFLEFACECGSQRAERLLANNNVYLFPTAKRTK